ncbi:MAG: hypothetical protein IID03_10235 [Candidatus Dadabacteria bacterium]|nr:hypothetical protein [Candidatus Dadabacteria bacterium]
MYDDINPTRNGIRRIKKLIKKLVDMRSEYLFRFGYFSLKSKLIYSAEIKIDTKDIKKAMIIEYSKPRVPIRGKKESSTEISKITAAAIKTFFDKRISSRTKLFP